GEVTADPKTPMQDLDRLAMGARLHGVGRNGWPAAIRHDALVVLDRGLGCLDVARRERRRAKRRIGDPLPCGFRALLGRKLVAMESACLRGWRGRLEYPAAAAAVAEKPAAIGSGLLIAVGVVLVAAAKPVKDAGVSSVAGGDEEAGRQGKRRAKG